MEKTKIFSIGFLVIAVVLAYFLGNSIFTSITESEKLANEEARVIAKLKMIREAQVAYQSVNGQYTSDWSKLKSFVDSGKFYLTNKVEHIITKPYGADSVHVEIDTLGTILVRDSLFTQKKYPGFDVKSLDLIPGTVDKKFDMWAEKIDKAGMKVDVVEVWDTAPTNPIRKESNEARTRKPLRFGSRTNISTVGNWE